MFFVLLLIMQTHVCLDCFSRVQLSLLLSTSRYTGKYAERTVSYQSIGTHHNLSPHQPQQSINSKPIITYYPTNPTINPANARHPHTVQGRTIPAALAPLEPAATQSFHAACISTTKAWPSGLSLPAWPYERGLTTGSNHPSAVKWV